MDEARQTKFHFDGSNVDLLNGTIANGKVPTYKRDGLERSGSDIATTLQDTGQPDLNSHVEVFNALLLKVKNSPHELSLLMVMQHLLDSDNDLIWIKATETIQRGIQNDIGNVSNGRSNASLQNDFKTALPILPPPAPPPPPPMAPNAPNLPATQIHTITAVLPQQNTPTPKVNMKTLYWDAIPSHRVEDNKNLWTILANSHRKNTRKRIDWSEAESQFGLHSSTNTTFESTMKRKETLKLLNQQRTFNIDIFLEQFKGYKSDNDIIELVYDGKHMAMGAEKINRLLKLLPEFEEIEMLNNFNGNIDALGRAEKFLLQLIKVPNYKLRIECMSLQEDFNENVPLLKASLKLVIQAGNELINCKKLHEVLYIIVLVGNFLNSGKYAGNAVGIKISSLLKLTQTRANGNNMNFMHFIVGQIKKSHPVLMNFPNDLKNLDKVNHLNTEQLIGDVKKLDIRLRNVKTQIELPHTEKDIKRQMMTFLKKAKNQIENLKMTLSDVESMRLNLSKFFCDDPSKFTLKECFKTFQSFVDNFKLAANERTEFESKTLLKQRERKEEETMRSIFGAKTSNGLTSGSPLTIKRIGKTNPDSNDFIRKEINREILAMGDVKQFLKPTNPEYNGNAQISDIVNISPDRAEESRLKPKQVSLNAAHEPSNMSVAEKIRKFRATNKDNENPLIDQEKPIRNNSIRFKCREGPAIPKYEKIGKRMSSITKHDLRDIRQNLKPTPVENKSLWNIPREMLLGNTISDDIQPDREYTDVSTLNGHIQEKEETKNTSIAAQPPNGFVSITNKVLPPDQLDKSHSIPNDNPQHVFGEPIPKSSTQPLNMKESSSTVTSSFIDHVSKDGSKKGKKSKSKAFFKMFRFKKKK